MGLTIRQLEIFAKVAATEHITKASQQLYLSQSAVSMAIAELEKQTGTLLFERRGKRLVMNERGRLLLTPAKKILALINSTMEIMQEGGLPTGILKVGASTTIGNYLLPSLIGSFMKQFPDTQVLLHVGNTQQIEIGVDGGQLDLGLIEGPSHLSSLLCKPWRDDELVVFASPEHPWSKIGSVTSDLLAAANWIVREEGSGTREVFQEAMIKQAGKMSIGLELGHTEAIKKAVEAGMGISCLSRLTIQRELEHKWLVEIKTILDLSRPLTILMHRDKFKTNLFNAFIDFLSTNN